MPGRLFWRRVGMVVLLGALGALAWDTAQWRGLVFMASGIVLWVLLQMTRLLTVMRRAAERPIGHVDSAVMLNARLTKGQSLLGILTLTRALGERLACTDRNMEKYRWVDSGRSSVTVEMAHGRLVTWRLERPAADDAGSGIAAADPTVAR